MFYMDYFFLTKLSVNRKKGNVNDKELVSVEKFIEFLEDQREFDFS